MTANDHLDHFGRTVSLAARVADQSHGSDVVMLYDVLDQADQSLYKGRDDITVEPFTTQLRGLAQTQRLARLTIRVGTQGATTAAASPAARI